jgi:hypothetical protein
MQSLSKLRNENCENHGTAKQLETVTYLQRKEIKEREKSERYSSGLACTYNLIVEAETLDRKCLHMKRDAYI